MKQTDVQTARGTMLQDNAEFPDLFSLSIGWMLLITLITGAMILMTTLVYSPAPAPSPADPFAAYVNIMPGTDRIHLLNAGFVCDQPNYCSRTVNDAYFSVISVTCVENIVAQVQFTVREGRLRIGDLSFFNNTPDIRFTRHTVSFSWGNVRASARVENQRFSYFTSLISITFSNDVLFDEMMAAL